MPGAGRSRADPRGRLDVRHLIQIMKVNGIVAEYNPFHNGHAYQLQHAKEANDV